MPKSKSYLAIPLPKQPSPSVQKLLRRLHRSSLFKGKLLTAPFNLSISSTLLKKWVLCIFRGHHCKCGRVWYLHNKVINVHGLDKTQQKQPRQPVGCDNDQVRIRQCWLGRCSCDLAGAAAAIVGWRPDRDPQGSQQTASRRRLAMVCNNPHSVKGDGQPCHGRGRTPLRVVARTIAPAGYWRRGRRERLHASFDYDIEAVNALDWIEVEDLNAIFR